MIWNLRIMLLQKVNYFKLCVLLWNQLEYFADEEIEDDLGVVLLICLNYAILGEIDQFVSSEPISSVPDTFDKFSD